MQLPLPQQQWPAACTPALTRCSPWVVLPLGLLSQRCVYWSSSIGHGKQQQLVSKGSTPVSSLAHTSKRTPVLLLLLVVVVVVELLRSQLGMPAGSWSLTVC
jgi:hypothetical protein